MLCGFYGWCAFKEGMSFMVDATLTTPVDLMQKWDWQREQMLDELIQMEADCRQESHFCLIEYSDDDNSLEYFQSK